MGDRESTVRMRELGLALRRALERAGLESKAVARELGWSPSKVSHVLRATRGVSERDVASILAMARIRGDERERLLELARRAHEPGWLQEFGGRLPPNLRTLIDHEDAAVAINSYQGLLVPGLLQVASYTRALMSTSATIPPDEIEERVDARIKRQEILDRRRPAIFRFFVDEYVLTRTGPGPEIMSEQLHHLLRMSVRPRIQFRVIPDAVGFHAAVVSSFVLMEFTEINPVLHLEPENTSVYPEGRKTIAGYQDILASLDTVALNPGQSREWIARLAHKLGAP
ncbi:helix-turn-helix protein [Herbihabitans rhizosphaerae]|uniref:Helix-turn-helix protein n=1 Tax=Herbihabitans rhizosphaerae TaxID=1872711 RepID=A0A4Q7KHU7_9PSEU|nr:helix-turn-helix transcriptional regulator [Herbihabitans rhizosphaerae]RZS34481.1 helix-turn-helix protein [Herbihabitans rhizosphaerae]